MVQYYSLFLSKLITPAARRHQYCLSRATSSGRRDGRRTISYLAIPTPGRLDMLCRLSKRSRMPPCFVQGHVSFAPVAVASNPDQRILESAIVEPGLSHACMCCSRCCSRRRFPSALTSILGRSGAIVLESLTAGRQKLECDERPSTCCVRSWPTSPGRLGSWYEHVVTLCCRYEILASIYCPEVRKLSV